jgi:hypothetical protein
VPDWFPLLRVARYYGVAPWVMAGVPESADAYCWLAWGAVAMEIDQYAQTVAERNARRTQARRGGANAPTRRR